VKVILTDSNESPAVVEESVLQPTTGHRELLVRVCAAGMTPTELLWYPTSHSKSGEKRSRAIPGHEFSGIIVALGEQVAGLNVGEEVYGMNDWFSDGAMAEYCITQPSFIAPKPSRLTHVEAASVPIGALTAWQGLFDRARLKPGERVLVHGGAGAVGVFAIQLARLHSAHVIATSSAHNLDFVTQLGAERVIDYRAARFEGLVRGIDVVFDTVGGDTLERSWGVLKPDGGMVTIAASSEQVVSDRVKKAFFIVEPNRAQLIEIGNLLEEVHLKPVVDTVLTLAQAAAVYNGGPGNRPGRGKMVVDVGLSEASSQKAT